MHVCIALHGSTMHPGHPCVGVRTIFFLLSMSAPLKSLQRKIFLDGHFSYNYIPCPNLTWRCAELLLAITEMLWIHVLDTPSYVWRDRVGGENIRAALYHIVQGCMHKEGQRSRMLSEAHHKRSALAMATIHFETAVFKILSLS